MNIFDFDYEDRSVVTSFASAMETCVSSCFISEGKSCFIASISNDFAERFGDVMDDVP